YHQQLASRLASRGYRVSAVCFESVPVVRDCAETYEVRPAPFDKSWLLWRFAAIQQHRHCARRLAALGLPPADLVIGGEHLFLKAHNRIFPETPWIYQPHSLLVDQEIKSYHLPWLMEKVTQWLYCSVQRWALKRADRTVRFTRQACEALVARY